MDDISHQMLDEQADQIFTTPTKSQVYEIPNRENFKCPNHPEYKIDALYFNEQTGNICLCCIKCFIDTPELTRNYRVWALKELFDRCVQHNGFSKSGIFISEGGVEDKIVEFMTKDYKGQYTSCLEKQHHRINQEINQLIENLTKLKEKVSSSIATRILEMDKKAEEIRKEIDKFISRTQDFVPNKFESVDEIYKRLSRIYTREQTYEFFKDIFTKLGQGLNNKADISKNSTIFVMIESFQQSLNSLKDQEYDLSTLKEIEQKVENLLQLENLPVRGFPLFPAELLNNIKLDLPEVSRSCSEENDFSYTFPSESFKTTPFSPQIKEESFPDVYSCKTVTKRRKSTFLSSQTKSTTLKNIKKEYSMQLGNSNELVRNLKEWVNRRVTGYLIFRNTLNSDPQGQEEKLNYVGMGIHLNHAMGDKWKNLSEDEKDDYNNLAKQFRKILKKEVDEAGQQGNLADLAESLDRKIKKIKKEK